MIGYIHTNPQACTFASPWILFSHNTQKRHHSHTCRIHSYNRMNINSLTSTKIVSLNIFNNFKTHNITTNSYLCDIKHNKFISQGNKKISFLG